MGAWGRGAMYPVFDHWPGSNVQNKLFASVSGSYDTLRVTTYSFIAKDDDNNVGYSFLLVPLRGKRKS